MSGFVFRTLMICFTIAILGSVALYLFFDRLGQLPAEIRNRQALSALPLALRPPEQDQLLVFVSMDGLTLRPQFVEVSNPSTPRSERLGLIVDEILRAAAIYLVPSSDGGHAIPFSRRAVYETDGIAVVDLTPEAGADALDFRAECLIGYGLVNSLADNFENVEAVQILIRGETAETLAGGLDISVPLVPNVALQVSN